MSSSGEYFTSCSFDKWPAENKVCNFDIKLLGTDCTKEEHFGYERGKPCIILKLNRIYGWVPEPYDDPNNLPAAMPTELKEYIKHRGAENKEQVTWSSDGSWFSKLPNQLNLNFTVENDLGLVWWRELSRQRTYRQRYIHTIPWIPCLLLPVQKHSRLFESYRRPAVPEARRFVFLSFLNCTIHKVNHSIIFPNSWCSYQHRMQSLG